MLKILVAMVLKSNVSVVLLVERINVWSFNLQHNLDLSMLDEIPIVKYQTIKHRD